MQQKIPYYTRTIHKNFKKSKAILLPKKIQITFTKLKPILKEHLKGSSDIVELVRD